MLKIPKLSHQSYLNNDDRAEELREAVKGYDKIKPGPKPGKAREIKEREQRLREYEARQKPYGNWCRYVYYNCGDDNEAECLGVVAIGGWSVGNVPFYQICVCEHCLEGGTVRDKPHKISTIPLEIITPKIPHYKEDIFLTPEQREKLGELL